MELCKLCKSNLADKKNSHTIPKFLGKSMLKQPNGKHIGYDVSFKNGDNDLNTKSIQDIHKKDFIFCSICEKKLGNFEKIFSDQVGAIQIVVI